MFNGHALIQIIRKKYTSYLLLDSAFSIIFHIELIHKVGWLGLLKKLEIDYNSVTPWLRLWPPNWAIEMASSLSVPPATVYFEYPEVFL